MRRETARLSIPAVRQRSRWSARAEDGRPELPERDVFLCSRAGPDPPSHQAPDELADGGVALARSCSSARRIQRAHARARSVAARSSSARFDRRAARCSTASASCAPRRSPLDPLWRATGGHRLRLSWKSAAPFDGRLPDRHADVPVGAAALRTSLAFDPEIRSASICSRLLSEVVSPSVRVGMQAECQP